MKKMLNLIIVGMFAIVSMQHTHPRETKTFAAPLSLGVNIYNGTGSNCSLYMSGPTSISATLTPGNNNLGPISAGTYTVYMYSPGGVERTYIFNGIHITNPWGSATFNNVNVVNNCYGAITQ